MPAELHPFTSGKWSANLPPLDLATNWFNNGSSFGYFPRDNVKSVFLGTFPTFDVVNNVIPGNLEFFYGEGVNNFWHIIRKITGNPLANEQEIFVLLKKANFGITDILKKVDRLGNGNADGDLEVQEFNDFLDLLINFPCLTTIYVTSGGRGPIQPGNSSAGGWLRGSIEQLPGFTTRGFAAHGYQKIVTIDYLRDTSHRLKLISIFSPANTANVAIQGQINANPTFAELIAVLPVAYANENMPNKGRVVQWGYLLYTNHFPLEPNLQEFVGANLGALGGLFA